MNRPGTVYLVGAGPGDPGLLTIRALELIRGAEVVAHDELVSPAIVAMIPPSVVRLRVGRRRGDEPRQALAPAVLEHAKAGRRVVRLKGGDPFIFGRGGEEAEELVRAGIPVEVVPGISAALGAAAYAGIPLTDRRCASQVTLSTGHQATAEPVNPSRAEGTLVMYMAAHRLREGLANLVARGRAAATPAALVESATLPEQRVVVGTLADLADRADGLQGTGPAVVVVGDVVSLRQPMGEIQHELPLRRDDGEWAPLLVPAPARVSSSPGLLLVYTGNGKGKTTAALGLAWRALGRGFAVAVIQFIKGKWKTGERLLAEGLPGLTFLVMGKGFTWESDDISRDRNAAQEAWRQAARLITEGKHAVVILDEITYVINYGFVPLEEVLQVLRARPSHVHAVVTGRNAPEELIAAADLVTEMNSLKHPFERGLKAQIGVDY